MFQQYRARHATVRAAEMAPVINGAVTDERVYVIDGVGVIDRDTFLSMYEPTSETPATPKKESQPRTGISVTDAVKQALAEGPKSLAALLADVRKLGATHANNLNVSTILSRLKSDGVVEKRIDRCWQLVAQESESQVVPITPAPAKLTPIALLRELLTERPLTIGEAQAELEARGCSSVTNGSVSAMLTTLRGENFAYRDDADGKWHRAKQLKAGAA